MEIIIKILGVILFLLPLIIVVFIIWAVIKGLSSKYENDKLVFSSEEEFKERLNELKRKKEKKWNRILSKDDTASHNASSISDSNVGRETDCRNPAH